MLADEGILQVRADRQTHRPYGLQGGGPGAYGRNVLDPGMATGSSIPARQGDHDRLRRGQGVPARSARRRKPWRRRDLAGARDLRDGLVTIEHPRGLSRRAIRLRSTLPHQRSGPNADTQARCLRSPDPLHDLSDRHRHRRRLPTLLPSLTTTKLRPTRSLHALDDFGEGIIAGIQALLASRAGKVFPEILHRHHRRLEHRAGGERRTHRSDHHAWFPRYPQIRDLRILPICTTSTGPSRALVEAPAASRSRNCARTVRCSPGSIRPASSPPSTGCAGRWKVSLPAAQLCQRMNACRCRRGAGRAAECCHFSKAAARSCPRSRISRTSTTVINAVQPVRAYITALDARLRASGSSAVAIDAIEWRPRLSLVCRCRAGAHHRKRAGGGGRRRCWLGDWVNWA